MQRSQDEVDEIIYGRSNHMIQYRQVQPNQRYIKARMQNQNANYSNGVNRSSSSSRTVDVYCEDLMTRSSDNYEYVLCGSFKIYYIFPSKINRESFSLCSYIRSSDDISSGYSSTEPVSMALSRTSSLTNATRYRPKTRRTEVSV